MKKIIIIILLISLSLSFIHKISAHNFDKDDNSSFLTLINNLLIQNRLLNNSISVHNNTDSFGHVKNIEDIVEEILISEDSFTIGSDQFYNNTVISLVVANLADEVLRNYGHAYRIPSYLMLSMNFTKVEEMQDDPDVLNLNTHNGHITYSQNSTSFLTDTISYGTSLEIANRMIEIYDKELKVSLSDSITNNALLNLGSALGDLRKNIESKEKPSIIMQTVHERIHPNLQEAFNLSINSYS